jgi:hypothetical protein
MKKLITILVLLFIFKTGFSQPISNRTFGTNTVGDPREFHKLNLFIPRYADTSAANSPTNIGIDSCGAIIFTYDVNGMWVRQCNPKKWARAGSSSRFGFSGEDVTSTSNRTFANGVYAFTQTWTSPTDATKVLQTTQTNFGGGFAYHIQSNWTTGGGLNPAYFISVGTGTTDGESFLESGIVIDAGNDFGEHKAIQVRTDSLTIGSPGRAGVKAIAIVGVITDPTIALPNLKNGTSQNRLLGQTSTNTQIGYITPVANEIVITSGTIGISPSFHPTTPISSLTAATGANTINNADLLQEWQWNTLANNGLRISSTSTATVNSIAKLFSIEMSGTQTVGPANDIYALHISASKAGFQTHTGIASIVSGSNTTNQAAVFSASGGTSLNLALLTLSGDVILNKSSGSTTFGQAGANKGIIKLTGNSSGTITIQPAAAAGTYTLTLPTTDGNANEFLQTDGSGVLTWAAAGSGTVTSFAFTDGSGFDGTVTNSTTTPTLALTTTISSGFVVYTTTAGAITGGASGIAINTATPEVDLLVLQ